MIYLYIFTRLHIVCFGVNTYIQQVFGFLHHQSLKNPAVWTPIIFAASRQAIMFFEFPEPLNTRRRSPGSASA